MTTMTSAVSGDADDDAQYDTLLATTRARFEAATRGEGRLFATGATGLFDAFLAELPPALRQRYTCNACRRFVERFGHLVVLDAAGERRNALWEPETVPATFRPSVEAMAGLVTRAEVTSAFLSEEKTWGLPINRDAVRACSWRHLAVQPAAPLVYKASPLVSASQRTAELRQDFETLQRALGDFSPEVVGQAHALLSTEALYRSEKVLGVATWLRELHAKLGATRDERRRANLVWYAVATAPAGFCHVRSSMIGTLLSDLAEGKSVGDVAAAFAAKMHPLQYQRPQAAPSAGNLAQAEKVVAALGSAGALARRFARLEDITEKVWSPPATSPAKRADAAGVFGHLRTREDAQRAGARVLDVPGTTTMTWVKFSTTVLPGAARIELVVPGGRAPFVALVTAADPAAPPVLQWDREERRNPVSWYFYNSGSPASQWGLLAGDFVEVTAVTLKPSMGGAGDFQHQGKGALFLLAGARDTLHERSGGFFVEMLRSEYHAVRKTLEAYMMGATVAGRDEATACGIAFEGQTFRVTSQGGTRTTIKLDRWD